MFKVLADECVHTDVITTIKEHGFDVVSVKEAGLTGCGDEEIFNFAIESKRILLTFDRGFGDIFRFNISKSAGVVIILVGQMNRKEIIKITLGFFLFIVKQADVGGYLAIVGRNKIRIAKR